jgi:chaperone required for assembly of F1-ATPase
MKRFYKTVSGASDADGWRIFLDGKPIRTPGKAELRVPTGPLAEALAFEWDAQTETIDPKSMPLNRFANTVIDGVAHARTAVVDEIAAYGETDLICYRAVEPMALVLRQQEIWNPFIVWAQQSLGAQLDVADGIVHLSQSRDALLALKDAIDAASNWQLAPLHTIVSITGSLVIGLALLSGRITAEAAWYAGLLDELFQAELWGEDDAAAAVRAARLADIQDAARFLALLRSN